MLTGGKPTEVGEEKVLGLQVQDSKVGLRDEGRCSTARLRWR